MKNELKLSLASLLLIVSMAFAFQDAPQKQDQKKEEKIKPLDVPTSSKSDDIVTQIDSLKKELADERKKNDSVNTIRKDNQSKSDQSLIDLRKANAQYRKSLNRLVFIVGKFNPDSVMKYYGEYKDDAVSQPDTTTKKKIDSSEVIAPAQKRSLFKRLFRRNH